MYDVANRKKVKDFTRKLIDQYLEIEIFGLDIFRIFVSLLRGEYQVNGQNLIFFLARIKKKL